MQDLKTAIENLYTAFSQYTTEGIYHCDCGCIDEENVKKLHSKPLRLLEVDDLCAYHGSALYTWGDLEHYKHFLPRVFELYASARDFALIDLYDIGNKLEYAEWTEWPADEVQAIKNFILEDWIDVVNNNTIEISDIILANYARIFDLKELLPLWKITQSDTALKNFVSLFYYYGNQVLDKGMKVRGKQHGEHIKELIYVDNFVNRLQEAFFKNETIDNDYAGKVSAVLQMIEQQFKLDQTNIERAFYQGRSDPD